MAVGVGFVFGEFDKFVFAALGPSGWCVRRIVVGVRGGSSTWVQSSRQMAMSVSYLSWSWMIFFGGELEFATI